MDTVHGIIGLLRLGFMGSMLTDCRWVRVSCTSVATARSSASRMESPSLFSCSARTLAASLGLSSSVASTRRVSLKSVYTPCFKFCCYWVMFAGSKLEYGIRVNGNINSNDE